MNNHSAATLCIRPDNSVLLKAPASLSIKNLADAEMNGKLWMAANDGKRDAIGCQIPHQCDSYASGWFDHACQTGVFGDNDAIPSKISASYDRSQ